MNLLQGITEIKIHFSNTYDYFCNIFKIRLTMLTYSILILSDRCNKI